MSQKRIEINVATQQLQVWEGRCLVESWPCSTGAAGVGFGEGSLRTPIGWFCVAEKIGADVPVRTRFVAREAVGLWEGGEDVEDAILTRILRLAGCEEANANTFQRFIYIHGTNAERWLGRAKSHGCVRLGGEAMVRVFDLVEEGTEVWISE